MTKTCCNGSLWYNEFSEKSTKNSFKSDVALKHACGQRPVKKQPQQELEDPARAKKATPAASTAVFDTISRNCAILQRDVSTLVAKTRESECLPENPCGVLWWPARALASLLAFCHEN